MSTRPISVRAADPARPRDGDEHRRGRDSISFHVDKVGVPVVVKESYFPNWQVHGADGPYRLAPNLMVVIPRQHDVSLTYGLTAGRLARPHRHAARIARSRRRSCCGRAHGATAPNAMRSRRRRPATGHDDEPQATVGPTTAARSRPPPRAAGTGPGATMTRPRSPLGGRQESPGRVARRNLQGVRHSRDLSRRDRRGVARRIGNAFAHVHGRATASSSATTCAPSSTALVAAVRRGRDPRRAPTSRRLGLCSTDLGLLRLGPLRRARRRCSPPATTRPQYNGIKLCRAGAAPVGEQTGLQQIKEMVASGVTSTAARWPARSRRVDLLDEFAEHVRSLRRPSTCCGRSRSSPTPRTAWVGSSSPRCSRACRSTSRSCSASSTAPSRTTPPTRSRPRT